MYGVLDNNRNIFMLKFKQFKRKKMHLNQKQNQVHFQNVTQI